MSNTKQAFIDEVQSRYNFKGEKLVLGKGILDGEVIPEAEVSVPLKMINRHGLIGGATGTGKTKSLQILAEQLSLKGVPSLVMDIKGDLSGLAAPGDDGNPKIQERHEQLGIPYQSQTFPVELMSISDEPGVRLRSTVLEFGPILFSKILGLNDTQQSIMSIIFKYAEDKKLPLIDLQDVRKLLQYVTEDEKGKEELSSNYGAIASSSLGAMLRQIVALEQQGADAFFGELSFEVKDLLQSKDGMGVINIVRLTDLQDKPHLFSTFMLSLMAEIYNTFPEEGDSDRPKLAIFIDEAHLIFKEASKTLLSQIETMVKLIRSKGVGLYFITQVPGDVPEEVLSQLGLKIQHALRGFTAKDKKEIEKAVENYPTSDFYDASEQIQKLGIGEAFVTALDEKGIPTPLVDTFMVAPKSRMDILSEKEINNIVSDSALVKKYENALDKESAYEILVGRMEKAQLEEDQELVEKSTSKKSTSRKKSTKEKSFFEEILSSPLVKDIGRTATREIIKILRK